MTNGRSVGQCRLLSGVIYQSQSAVTCQDTIFTVYMLLHRVTMHTYIKIYKTSVSPCLVQLIIPYFSSSRYNGNLVTWTFVWFAASYIFCVASPCPILRTCAFSWLLPVVCICIIVVIRVYSYAYGSLQAVCKSGTGLVERRTLFCGRRNIIRWLTAANSQAG